MTATMKRLPLLIAALLSASIVWAADRNITDDTGHNVAIPEAPQRIVVLHEPLLGLPLMDLGVDIVGSYGRGDDGKFVTAVDFIDTVLGAGHAKPKGIGAVGQLDLEKLRALNPDLIIGSELDADKAQQLSSVAPVYLQNVSTGKVHGFEVEEKLARLVGRKDVFEKRKAEYLERLAAVRKTLPPEPEQPTYLAVFLTDQLNAIAGTTGAVQAIEDLGFKRLELENKTGVAGQGGSMFLVPLSAESFGRLNPNLLVLMNSYMSAERDEAGTSAALDRIVPGWKQFLKPAKESRVLFLDSAKVVSPTVASAEHTLDAVEEWAKKQPAK